MENTPVQLAIREMKQQVSSPRFWVGLLCVVGILTVAAPFETGEQLDSLQRFFYWLCIAISTYFAAIFILQLVCEVFRVKGKSELLARAVGSVLAGFVVTLVVFFINALMLDMDNLSWKDFVFLAVNCMLIALAVSTIFFVVSDSLQQHTGLKDTAVDLQPPVESDSPFYQRLPEALGTDLISLQAQDHYVEAKTALGKELILVRLSDAMKELGDSSGMQVHRSWWVAHQHIVEQKRINNKPHLILSDDSAVPVS